MVTVNGIGMLHQGLRLSDIIVIITCLQQPLQWLTTNENTVKKSGTIWNHKPHTFMVLKTTDFRAFKLKKVLPLRT
jgi:hypothetical protein